MKHPLPRNEFEAAPTLAAGAIFYLFIGTVAGLAASGEAVVMSTGRLILMVVGLVATVPVSILITRIAREAIAPRGLDAMAGETATADAVPTDGCADETDIRVSADLTT